MAIQGFFTGDVKIRELNGVLKAVNGIVEVATDAGTVTSVGLTVGSTGTDVNVANSPITTSGSITLNLPTASATNRGLLSSADWTTFNSKQAALTLTTTGNNGSATLISGTLNIPTYTLAGLGGISLTSLSASSPLLYNNTTGVFSIQVANGSQNGYLSSTDWTTFNSKQSALTFSAPLVNTSGTISIPAATSSVNGYLTSTDWSTFNSKQGTITLTTTGSSGAATLVGDTLNIPNYTSGLTGYVPYTGATADVNLGVRTLSANSVNIIGVSGAAGYLGLKQSASVIYGGGGYTSLNGEDTIYLTMYFSQDLTGTNYKLARFNSSALTNNTQRTYNLPNASGTLALTSDLTGYVTTVTASSPLFSSGGTTPNITIQQASGSQNGYLSSTDWTTFNNKQAAGNYITALTGEATASGPGSATVTLSTSAVTGKLLTGLNLTGGGTIAATDSILQAFGKVQNQISGMVGGVTFQGTWNASTNTPTLTSSVGTKGYYYIVDVAGSTNLNGITDWKVGDWAIFNGSTWDKVDNTDSVSSVNGFTGAVSLTTANISEVTNLYYLDSRARASISLTTTGTSGVATYDNTTGVFNIPNYGSALTGYVPYTGATGAVNLGAFDLTVQTLTIGKGNSSLANNTALGYRTLFHITTGNYNTAVGYEAAHNTTTGQYNTALGQSALFTNTTGSQNTALGLNALLYNTSGGSNVVVGLDAMQHNTTGSSNTVLGYNAGSHITGGSTPNTTASSSVYIGRDTKAKVDNGTNEIVIGYNAVGNGSNTATFGNTSTTANYFTGSINGGSFVKIGGTSSQFLKADGSVDSSTYLTTSDASSLYLPLTGGTLTGQLTINSALRIKSGAATGVLLETYNTNQLVVRVTPSSTTYDSTLIFPSSSRNFTFPAASGTIALTSDIPSLSGYVQGTGTTNYLPKFTGASTIGDSNLINDASGNLGLGVTPSAWTSIDKAIEIGKIGNSIFGGGINDTTLTANAYFSGGWKYGGNGAANLFSVGYSNNTFVWLTAPSGTAGNAISFTQAMTLDASGRLGIGNTTMSSFDSFGNQLVVGNGSTNQGITIYASTSTESSLYFADGTGAASYRGYIYYRHSNDSMFFGTSAATALTLASTGAATFSSDIQGGGDLYFNKATRTTIYPTTTNQNLHIKSNGSGVLQLNNDNTGNLTMCVGGGNVGIGTSTFNYSSSGRGYLAISGSTDSILELQANSAAAAYLYAGVSNVDLNTLSNRALTFSTNTSERMRITSGGELLWNLTGDSSAALSAGGVLFRNNSGKYLQISTGVSTNAELIYFYKSDGAGGATNTGSIATSGNLTLYNTTSDYRLKEDFKDYNALNIIGKLKTYDFKWKGSDTRDFGMIAHELQEILPTYVNGKKDAMNEDGSIKTQGVDYSKIVPVLIKSIQELKQELDTLKNK
jgi:hypothetical protein